MPSKRLLLIGVETLSRELDGYLLLAHQATLDGWDVVLARRHVARSCSEMIGSGVLLQNAGGLGDHYPADRSACPGLRLVQYHQEGLAYRSEEEVLARYPEHLTDMDLVFTFGERQTELVASQRPQIADRLVTVGSPRFDILDARYRDLLLTEKDGQRFPDEPFVLVNTSFPWGNPSRLYGGIFEDGRRRPAKPPDWWVDRPERRPGYEALYHAYVDMVHELALSDGALPVVLRPHPSEDHDNWREALADLPNVEVSFAAAAVEWIRRARVMIHTGCTTGLEGRFLGKPVLRYNPVGEVDEPQLPNLVSTEVSSVEEMLQIAKAASEDPAPQELTAAERRILRPYLANADGPVSCERMLDALDGLEVAAAPAGSLNTLAGRLSAADSSVRARGRRLIRRLRRAFGGAAPKAISDQKFPGLGSWDVEPRLRVLGELDGAGPAEALDLGRDVVAVTRR